MKHARYTGFAACSGCSLCLLACPVWDATRDIRLTPHGRAKALQHGATAYDLAASLDTCTLCGACEPACPEEIDLVSMVLDLRSALNHSPSVPIISTPPASKAAQKIVIVPDSALTSDAALLALVQQAFGGDHKARMVFDNGADIALALEAGTAISDERRIEFLAALRLESVERLIVGDGILLRALRHWLPNMQIESLGVAMSSLSTVKNQLLASDFYVIEARAYHADRERLVQHYDGLRIQYGCAMNLDLQRLAISTTATSLPMRLGRNVVDPYERARWILQGYEFSRVIVEDLNELAVFSAVTSQPVIYLAQLVSELNHHISLTNSKE
ncbi:MAG: 4Fe-4S dicluster domain-containing protein [Undibacterium sp.]|nr:4Fe-4S dicluster domain-containing protein [Undibacterium sp.]